MHKNSAIIRKKRVFLGIIACLLCIEAGQAQEPPVRVQLQADKTQIEEREDFRLTIQIQAQNENVEVASQGIDIPGIENFAQIGTSNATNIQVINGQSLIESSIIKVLVPKQQGTYTLGPVTIPIKNRQGAAESVETNTVTVTVVPASGSANSTPPSILGDATDLFQPVEQTQVEWIPQTNTWFWVQIGGMMIVLWGGWFLLNKKIEQKKKPVYKTPDEKQTETEGLQKGTVLPDTQDPEFLEKIHTLLVAMCQKHFVLTPAKMTKGEVLPTAQKKLNPDQYGLLNDILTLYEKARFGKMSINRMDLKQKLESLQKTLYF